MKSLAICLLVLGIGLVGCSKGPTTGWHCPDCKEPVAESADSCPNCGSQGIDLSEWDMDGPYKRWKKD